LALRRKSGALAVLTLTGALGAVSCKGSPDPEASIRAAWVEKQAFAGDAGAVWRLTSNERIFFDDGWSPMETAPQGNVRGEAWRWMGRSSLLRLRTATVPMTITITGWVPAHLLLAPPLLTFRFNGSRLEAMLAPNERFTRSFVISAERQRGSSFGDFAIETSTVGIPPNDGRELGYALADVRWEPAPAP